MIILSLLMIAMLTNCEQKIIELLLPQPYKAYSVRKISELIKSSYALTHGSINSLIKKKLITVEKIGHSLSCQLNLSADPQLLAAASLEYSYKFSRNLKFSFLIDEIKTKLSDLIYVMILFGSYAKGNQRKKSDLDLLFVIQNENDLEETENKIKSVLSLTNVKVDFKVTTTAWLLKMFGEKYSVGREILKASVVLHGAEQYYSLVKQHDQKRGY